MTDFKVPKAVSGESQDRPYAAKVHGAKADLQTVVSFSLTWLDPVQRELTATNACLLVTQFQEFGAR